MRITSLGARDWQGWTPSHRPAPFATASQRRSVRQRVFSGRTSPRKCNWHQASNRKVITAHETPERLAEMPGVGRSHTLNDVSPSHTLACKSEIHQIRCANVRAANLRRHRARQRRHVTLGALVLPRGVGGWPWAAAGYVDIEMASQCSGNLRQVT